MPADDEHADRLRKLHDAYVWQVNSAIAAGRPDLARELADEYADEAMALLAAGYGPACDRPDCPQCARPALRLSSGPPPATPPPPGWLRRLFVRR
jgi:hypothetical protein